MRFLGGGLWSHFSNVRDFFSGAGRDRFGSRADEFGIRRRLRSRSLSNRRANSQDLAHFNNRRRKVTLARHNDTAPSSRKICKISLCHSVGVFSLERRNMSEAQITPTRNAAHQQNSQAYFTPRERRSRTLGLSGASCYEPPTRGLRGRRYWRKSRHASSRWRWPTSSPGSSGR